MSKTWQLLYICSEPHCKTIAYKVTTTIPIDFKLTYTKLKKHAQFCSHFQAVSL